MTRLARANRWARMFIAAVLTTGTFVVASAGVAHAADAVPQVFGPGCTTWTMPNDAGAVHVDVLGAAGNDGPSSGSSAAGGLGDAVAADIALASGAQLRVCVGWGAGVATFQGGARGGGATGIALGNDFAQPLVVAGGGGGGATNTRGGDAGMPVAGAGHASPGTASPGGGGGGGDNTLGAGGAPGAGGGCGSAGSAGVASTAGGPGSGGVGGGPNFCDGKSVAKGGGGGGGGYFGGGGGGGGFDGGAGGGGTDFCSDSTVVTNCVVTAGAGGSPAAALAEIRYASATTTTVIDGGESPWVDGDEGPGQQATDRAPSVTGTQGIVPTGAVDFDYFTNGTCDGTPSAQSAGSLAGGSASSAPTAALVVGDYSFRAQYSGDGMYGPSVGACEPFSVNPSPFGIDGTLHDAATGDTFFGGLASPGALFDRAFLTNPDAGVPPTGTMTYDFYTNNLCTAPAYSTETVALGPDGSTPDSSDTPPLPGGDFGYHVQYSGDTHYPELDGGCAGFTIDGPTPRPAVASISPANGPVTGGTPVTITGSGFVLGTTVAVGQGQGTTGAIAATDVVVVSPTELHAVIGGGARRGKFQVRVTSPGGTSLAAPGATFTYTAIPTVTSVAPSSGPMSGGTAITIFGTGFGATTATVLVAQGHGARAGAIPATDVVVVSPTEITAITGPATRFGNFEVFVVTPGGATSPPNPAAKFKYVR